MASTFIRYLFAFFLLWGAFPIAPVSAAIDQDYPAVKLQTLDKATARTQTVIVNVGQTVEFGSLFIKVQACRKSGPLDQPESASFLQIWEVPINSNKSEWVFSGWMFASSPALSAMDHPVYDVWVLDCAGGEPKGTPQANVTVKIDGVEIIEEVDQISDGSPEEEPMDSEAEIEAPEIKALDQALEDTINSVLGDDLLSDEPATAADNINYE